VPQVTTAASGNSLETGATEQVKREAMVPGAQLASAPAGPVVPPMVRFLRAEVCGVSASRSAGIWPCSSGTVLGHTDVCGTAPAILPLWKSTRAGVGAPWSNWVLLTDVTCTGTPDPSGEQILAAFRRLPIAPSVLHVQPDRGWVLVNIDTIAYTDPTTQTLTTTVLGVQVQFTVTPATYTWDYGETIFTTATPGHPYPDQDVAYQYRHLGNRQINLTTTWQATYTTSTNPNPNPRPVPGTATTTTPGPTLQILEARAHLTRGTCTDYPHDPGC
jgi:hypothetical protein